MIRRERGGSGNLGEVDGFCIVGIDEVNRKSNSAVQLPASAWAAGLAAICEVSKSSIAA